MVHTNIRKNTHGSTVREGLAQGIRTVTAFGLGSKPYSRRYTGREHNPIGHSAICWLLCSNSLCSKCWSNSILISVLKTFHQFSNELAAERQLHCEILTAVRRSFQSYHVRHSGALI